MDEVRTVSISHWKNCPFRGQPHMPIDDRCPTTLRAYSLPVELTEKASLDPDQPLRKRGRPRKDEVREEVVSLSYAEEHLVPMLEAGSYCQSCTQDRVREKELGMKFSNKVLLPNSGRKRKM